MTVDLAVRLFILTVTGANLGLSVLQSVWRVGLRRWSYIAFGALSASAAWAQINQLQEPLNSRGWVSLAAAAAVVGYIVVLLRNNSDFDRQALNERAAADERAVAALARAERAEVELQRNGLPVPLPPGQLRG